MTNPSELVKGAELQVAMFKERKGPVVVLYTSYKDFDPVEHIIFENFTRLQRYVEELAEGKKWKAELRKYHTDEKFLRSWHVNRMDGKYLGHAQEMEIVV